MSLIHYIDIIYAQLHIHQHMIFNNIHKLILTNNGYAGDMPHLQGIVTLTYSVVIV